MSDTYPPAPDAESSLSVSTTRPLADAALSSASRRSLGLIAARRSMLRAWRASTARIPRRVRRSSDSARIMASTRCRAPRIRTAARTPRLLAPPPSLRGNPGWATSRPPQAPRIRGITRLASTLGGQRVPMEQHERQPPPEDRPEEPGAEGGSESDAADRPPAAPAGDDP